MAPAKPTAATHKTIQNMPFGGENPFILLYPKNQICTSVPEAMGTVLMGFVRFRTPAPTPAMEGPEDVRGSIKQYLKISRGSCKLG